MRSLLCSALSQADARVVSCGQKRRGGVSAGEQILLPLPSPFLPPAGAPEASGFPFGCDVELKVQGGTGDNVKNSTSLGAVFRAAALIFTIETEVSTVSSLLHRLPLPGEAQPGELTCSGGYAGVELRAAGPRVCALGHNAP